MFCYQCQEALSNKGCTHNGVCGKKGATSNLMDLLIYNLKGLSLKIENSERAVTRDEGRFIADALFTTITNANFDDKRISQLLEASLILKNDIQVSGELGDAASWSGSVSDFAAKAETVGVLATENEDIRSLRELLIYGLKGIAAYAHHAYILGREDTGIYQFLVKALATTLKDVPADELTGLILEAGNVAVTTMALLDAANTDTYGNPEITEVSTGVGTNPGILVSGHDLKDIKELLEQTEGRGIDIYTHSEMLPAHYYPELKKYTHLKGNYGSSWWKQNEEFEKFNGPILMTTNCITPVKESYKDRIFTTGTAGYPGVEHIAERRSDGAKDFSKVIEKAKSCKAPVELDNTTIVGGFAHNQVMALADKVVEAVKSGAVKRFVVMAGCDGRQKDRSYFEDVAKELPEDTIILTAGCAKYRYNKLGLGDIGGIPRVLDAGQCNDSYSLAVIALKLKEVFELDDINDLPISYDIAWYEQKAVAVLLALLALGVKGIRLGPTLPAFLSPNVAKVLVDNFNIKPTGDVKSDIEAMMKGR